MRKDKILHVRIDQTQMRRLEEVAEAVGVKPAVIMRQLLDRATVRPALAIREETR